MDLATAGLDEQPFPTYGKPVVTVRYGAYRDALTMLKKSAVAVQSVTLLQGPSLSGKSTVLQAFVHSLPEDCSSAFIDGSGLRKAALLEAILRQVGYLADFKTTGELLAMTRVFALQQASSDHSPVVVIENAESLSPGAWQVVVELAKLRVGHKSAIKLILASDGSLRELLESPDLIALSENLNADFHLRAMTIDEGLDYLHSKLRAAGSDMPEFIFSDTVCAELWRASGGWPGVIDRIALLALARAETLPVAVSSIVHPVLPQGTWDTPAIEDALAAVGDPPTPPTLHITDQGKATKSLVFDKPRLMIGRSEHNDLSLDSRWVSRHHLLLIRNEGATYLVDLNSTNGSFVNSRRVSTHALADDDIITLGQHRIKFCDPASRVRANLGRDTLSETDIMRTLDDLRVPLPTGNTALPSG